MNKCAECDRKAIARRLCRKHYNDWWRAEYPEKARSHAKNTRSKHREDRRLRAQAWREKNRNRDRDNARKYRAKYPEKARAAVKRWTEANPERTSSYHARRRALEKEGGFTKEEWRDLCFLYGGICPRCSRAVKRFTVDHIVPLSKGGANRIWNLQPLCKSCNCSKNDNLEGFYPPACYSM